MRFARLYWWPGPIHEGNGVRRTIIEEQATKEQRDALIAYTKIVTRDLETVGMGVTH